MWKPITGYEGLYEVSDEGEVKSLPRSGTSGRLINVSFTRGYAYVTLSKANKIKRMRVGRIVLNSFVGPNPNSQCNHKNGIKSDDSLLNLEWVTGIENIRHRIATLGIDHSKFGQKYTDAQVDEMRNLRKRGVKISTIGNRFGISYGCVWHILRHRH